MTSRNRLQLLAIGALSLAAPNTHAQDEEALDRTTVDCVTVPRIKRMQVIDTQTLLFRMTDGRLYRNRLHEACPNIDRASNWIEYPITASRLPRLCQDDLITTKEQSRCRLGPFEPITAEEAEALTEAADTDPAVTGVEVSPTTLPHIEPLE
jgi:hypothetical protein